MCVYAPFNALENFSHLFLTQTMKSGQLMNFWSAVRRPAGAYPWVSTCIYVCVCLLYLSLRCACDSFELSAADML